MSEEDEKEIKENAEKVIDRLEKYLKGLNYVGKSKNDREEEVLEERPLESKSR